MKRDFLKEQGLSDDAIDKVLAEYGKDVNGLKQELSKATYERDALNEQLDERTKQLAKFKDQDGLTDKLKAQIDKLQADNAQAAKDYQAKLAKQEKSFLIDKAITKSGARNVKAVSALLDLDAVTVKDGALNGLSEQLAKLQESDAYMFKQETAPAEPAKPAGSVQITGGQPTNAPAPKIDLAKATYGEVKAFKEAHPQEYAKLTQNE